MLTYILLIGAMILSIYAQSKVRRTFDMYSRITISRPVSGADAARMVLNYNGVPGVSVNPIGGTLSDHYNPSNKQLNLSGPVYSGNSISSISVACHEAGHAIQHERGYLPLKLRNSIVPLANFTSKLTMPMVFIGLMLLYANQWYLGNLLFNIGVIGFSAVVLFHLITLPVEIDASKRAMEQIRASGILTEEEMIGARRVLTAAALTYIAALAVSVANLLRILSLRGRR